MKNKKFYKPKVFSTLIISLILAALIAGNFMYLYLISNIISIATSILLIPLFIFFFLPVVRYQRVRIEGDKIIIKYFWNTYILSVSKDFYEIHNNESYRFRNKNKFFQVSPLAYKQSNDLKRQLNERIKKLNKKVEATWEAPTIVI